MAVCENGGIGSIAVGPLPADPVRLPIQQVRARTAKPLNVNFITFLCRPEQIEVCIEQEVPIVSFHWGHPSADLIARLHAGNVKVLQQVGSADAARKAVGDGIDLVIAQGSEAGGHNCGTLPTFVLVPEVVDAVSPVPVLAAGGITTGRQLAAALALGADGAWVGTRFVASTEAFAHPEYKRRLLNATGTDTRLTSVYGLDIPAFNPMRVLDAGLAREYAGHESELPSDTQKQPQIGTMRLVGQEIPIHRFSSFVPTPDTEGDISLMPFLAGQGVGLVRDIRPVSELMSQMVDEAAGVLSRLSTASAPSGPGRPPSRSRQTI